MAQGDILSVNIDSTGHVAVIEIDSFGTSGSMSSGFLTNTHTLLTASTPNVNITCYSKGFDDDGNFTYITRSIVGTKFVRKVFPSQSFADETTGSNGNLLCKINLSDYIYSEDTGSISIATGFYTSASIQSNELTDFTISNSSSIQYPKVIGNWYWPCWDIATGSHYKLRMGAFHRSAEQGRPVRFVKFIATDNSGNTVSSSIYNVTIDSGGSVGNPIPEYIYDLPLESLTQGQVITCSFKAYPWYGNNDSILDTTLSPYTHSVSGLGTPYYANIYVLNDKNNSYGKTVCVVDSVLGNDSTGLPIDSASFDPLSPPPAFATIGKAASSASNYNNTVRGRNDVGNAVIYLQSGSHRWLGSSNSYGTTPLTYITITSLPGVDRTLVLVSGSAGNTDITDRIKFENVSITQTGNSSVSSGVNYLWVDNCYISSSGNAPFHNNRNMIITRNTVQLLQQNFVPFAGTTGMFTLIRGNYFSCSHAKYPGTRGCFNYIGNRAERGTALFTVDDGNMYRTSWHLNNMPTASNVIFAYNSFYKMRAAGNTAVSIYDYNNIAGDTAQEFHGCAIVQNIIEHIDDSTASPCIWVAADGNFGDYVHHVLSWHNVIVGQRQSWGYNDSGSNVKWKINWQAKNNICDAHGTKTDWFTGYGFGDPNRIGNFSIINGVGHKGNWWGHFGNVGAQFELEFCGLNSVIPVVGSYPINYIQYIDRKSATATSDGSGSGNYQLSASSPAVTFGSGKYDYILPYDINGNPRNETTTYPGAFRYYIDSEGNIFIPELYCGFFIGN